MCYTEIIGCWKERKETTVRAWKDESSNWDQAIVFYDSLHTPVNQWKKLDKNSKVVLHGKVSYKTHHQKHANTHPRARARAHTYAYIHANTHPHPHSFLMYVWKKNRLKTKKEPVELKNGT